MSEAPKRIWAQPSGWPPNWKFGHWDLVDDGGENVEYVRADEIERLQAELREAREVMRRVQSLNNAIRDDEGYHWAHASVIEEEITAFLAK